MQMPDVTGQPWWVVIVVAALGLMGGVGTTLLQRRAKRDDQDTEEPEALPVGEGGEAYQAVKMAIQALADVAKREADESTEARANTDKLRHQLEECARALELAESARVAAERKLSQCEDNARILIRRLQEGEAG